MLEFERKYLLSKSEYETICNSFAFPIDKSRHENYYYDTSDLKMNEKGITCRIRKKDNMSISTIKNHRTMEKDCSIECSGRSSPIFDDSRFIQMGLLLQGVLTTERSVLYKDDSCEIVVDRNAYLGEMDYELEIEYNYGKEDIADLFAFKIALLLTDSRQIKCPDEFCKRSCNSKNKSERFFKRLLFMKTIV